MSEEVRVYGFCENKCRREVMTKEKTEELLDEKIDKKDIVNNAESTATDLPVSADVVRALAESVQALTTRVAELETTMKTCVRVTSFNASTGALVTKHG